jgi:hypothetical protein
LLERPKGQFVVAALQRGVVQGQGRPFSVAGQTRRVTFGEKPLESAQGAGEGFTLNEQQRFVG